MKITGAVYLFLFRSLCINILLKYLNHHFVKINLPDLLINNLSSDWMDFLISIVSSPWRLQRLLLTLMTHSTESIPFPSLCLLLRYVLCVNKFGTGDSRPRQRWVEVPADYVIMFNAVTCIFMLLLWGWAWALPFLLNLQISPWARSGDEAGDGPNDFRWRGRGGRGILHPFSNDCLCYPDIDRRILFLSHIFKTEMIEFE